MKFVINDVVGHRIGYMFHRAEVVITPCYPADVAKVKAKLSKTFQSLWGHPVTVYTEEELQKINKYPAPK